MSPYRILVNLARTNAVKTVVRAFGYTLVAVFASKLASDAYDAVKKRLVDSHRAPDDAAKRR